MILGIGVDMEQVSRLKKAMENPRFLEKCFTASEREYILARANAPQSAAGMFCAKEALIKAAGGGPLSLQEIEILHEKGGRPYMRLAGRALAQAGGRVHLSISHTGDVACAQVVIEDGGEDR